MGKTSFIKIITFGLYLLSFESFGQIQSKYFEKYPGIHTVYLAPNTERYLIKQNPVIPLENQSEWFINFDDLDLKYKNYFLRIVHCDANWKDSNLNEIEYLQDFNDQPIRDFRTSLGTKVPYNHYTVEIPKGKISGNYVAILYANRNTRDTVFSIRYSIVDRKTSIFSKVNFANQNEYRKTHQSVSLGFKYQDQLIINDESNLHLTYRRVNSSENLIKKLPTPIHNASDKTFYYPFFGTEGLIPGSNEYRIIDLRSAQQRLSFVSSLNQEGPITSISTFPESPQGNYSYTQKNDMNGNYFIENYENQSNNLYADYVYCDFQLKTKEILDNKIYLSGGFTQMEDKNKNELVFDESTSIYRIQKLVKQGIYNYQFTGNKEVFNYLEGNFSQTENEYEVLIYFKQPGTRYEALIGFQEIKFP